jgi:hypothetical protein
MAAIPRIVSAKNARASMGSSSLWQMGLGFGAPRMRPWHSGISTSGPRMLLLDPFAPTDTEEPLSGKQFLSRVLTLLAAPLVFVHVLVSSFFYFWDGDPLRGAILALFLLPVPIFAWKAWKYFPWAGIFLFCAYILAMATRLPVCTAYGRLALHLLAGLAVLLPWLWLVRPPLHPPGPG